jgi:hypothetical protein
MGVPGRAGWQRPISRRWNGGWKMRPPGEGPTSAAAAMPPVAVDVTHDAYALTVTREARMRVRGTRWGRGWSGSASRRRAS